MFGIGDILGGLVSKAIPLIKQFLPKLKTETERYLRENQIVFVIQEKDGEVYCVEMSKENLVIKGEIKEVYNYEHLKDFVESGKIQQIIENNK